MKAIIKKYPIWSFIFINYLVSWTFLYPSYQIILNNESITPLALFGLIGAYGPSIAAIVIQYISDKENLKTLLKKIIHVKTGLVTWIFIFTVPVLLYIVSDLISSSVFATPLKIDLKGGMQAYGFYFFAALPFGPMGEELGWRGFMLPRLLEKHSVLKSTFLVGMAWGLWHLASFTFPGAAIPDFLPVNIATIGLFCLNTISLSMMYTYIHFKSGGSVMMAILLHAFFNAAASIASTALGGDGEFRFLLTSYILNFLLAAILGYALLKKDVQQ